jgi:hypothetical protein
VIAELGFGFYRPAHPTNIPLIKWNYQILNAIPSTGWPSPIITTSSNTQTYRYQLEKFEINALRSASGSSLPTLQILFQTNFGARIFTLSIPTNLNENSYRDFVNDINERCNANQDLINMFEDKIGDLRDILNAPRDIPGRNLIDSIWWTINFKDVDPRSRIAIQTKMSNKLVTLDGINLSKSGSGRLDFWQSEKELDQSFFLATKGLEKPSHGKDPKFMVGMKAFQKRGIIPLSGSYVEHKLLRNQQGTFLMVLTKSNFKIFLLDETKEFREIFLRNNSEIQRIEVRGGSLFMANSKGELYQSVDGKQWNLFDTKYKNVNTFSSFKVSQVSMGDEISSRDAIILSESRKELYYMEQIYSDLGSAKPSKKKPVPPVKTHTTIKNVGYVKGIKLKIPKPKF